MELKMSLCSCLLAVIAPVLGMYDGQVADITNYPYMASILIGDMVASTLWCSGIIINKQWVLTTGTCAWIYPPLDLLIVVGSNDGQVGTGTVYTVEDTKWYPNMDPDVYYYQYGLIKINGEFKWSKTVQKATLPTKDIKLGTQMEVVAFAFQDGVEDGSNRNLLEFNLKKGTMNWISSNKCVHNDSSLEEVDTEVGAIPKKKTLVCAYNKGKTTMCTCEYGAAYVKDGVVYGQFIEGDKSSEEWRNYCTAQAQPEAVSIIKPAVSWIKQITGLEED